MSTPTTTILYASKLTRQDLDQQIKRWQLCQTHKQNPDLQKCDRELEYAIKALQEARMWFGMVLQKVGEPYPYPNGETVNSPYVDPPADTK